MSLFTIFVALGAVQQQLSPSYFAFVMRMTLVKSACSSAVMAEASMLPALFAVALRWFAVSSSALIWAALAALRVAVMAVPSSSTRRTMM